MATWTEQQKGTDELTRSGGGHPCGTEGCRGSQAIEFLERSSLWGGGEQGQRCHCRHRSHLSPLLLLPSLPDSVCVCLSLSLCISNCLQQWRLCVRECVISVCVFTFMGLIQCARRCSHVPLWFPGFHTRSQNTAKRQSLSLFSI